MDLNADMGEAATPEALRRERALLDVVTSCSVACAFHAGDPGAMARTLRAARERGVGAGAHPGYRDPAGFGRRPLEVAPSVLQAELVYQVGAFCALARWTGVEPRHVKLHGALYHRALGDPVTARALVAALAALDGPRRLFVPAPSALADCARRAGLTVVREGFADRRYRSDGTLVPRGEAGAVITDPEAAAAQAVRLAQEGRVTAVDGTQIRVQVDTISLHGDTPGADELARRVRAALVAAGVPLAPP